MEKITGMDKDYNTQREKLYMPEYGRNIQKMIEYVCSIEDRDKRNEQIREVVKVMGILNPQLRDIEDFKHKLWDHVQIISDFKIDIDSPYPLPTKEAIATRPDPIPFNSEPIKAACYGRNIQNMINSIVEQEDPEIRRHMIKVIAEYMRQQYLIWNKDSVSDETIFHDMVALSDNRLEIPEDMRLSSLSAEGGVQKNKSQAQKNNQKNGQKNQQGKKKKWKKNGNQ